MARKAHAPTDESRKQVETMAGLLLPHDDIAAILGISDETLRKHYRAELGVGRAKGNLAISDRLHKKAKDGNIAALIFLAKVRLGWSEKIKVENSGPDGGPLKVYMSMTEEELAKHLAQLNEALKE
jgi:hypothetical protein